MGRIYLPATDHAIHIAAVWIGYIFKGKFTDVEAVIRLKSVDGRRFCHEMVYQNR
jgi:hypothetical protein